MSTSAFHSTCRNSSSVNFNMEHSPGHCDLTDLFSEFDEQPTSSFEFSDLFDDFSEDSFNTDENLSKGIPKAFFTNNDTENTNFYDTETYSPKEAITGGADVNCDAPDIIRILKQMSSDVQSPTSSDDAGPVSMCIDNSVSRYDENYNIHPIEFTRTKSTDENRPKCKRIRKRKSQRKSVRLFEFLWHYLNTEPNGCVAWVDKTAGIFRLVDNKQVAELWGKYKNNEKMTYESLSRGLRHYYRRGIFERMSQKLHYRFVPRAIELCKQSRLLI